LFSEV